MTTQDLTIGRKVTITLNEPSNFYPGFSCANAFEVPKGTYKGEVVQGSGFLCVQIKVPSKGSGFKSVGDMLTLAGPGLKKLTITLD